MAVQDFRVKVLPSFDIEGRWKAGVKSSRICLHQHRTRFAALVCGVRMYAVDQVKGRNSTP